MSEPINVSHRMREDWNRRAVEDAHYYVAFGRRDQDPEEFFATATEIFVSLEAELRRLPPNSNPRSLRALEIGCGPGRLMKPMSRHFGEIHGVDVADEMIARARHNLRDIPHAHTHATTGADLNAFADQSFDFVYSYAVFQHIPSRDVVFSYLREARRVLKPGGILRCQANGLDRTAKTYDTWSGVRISAGEIIDFARENDMQLLALEGVRTQYMWMTMRKQPQGWRESFEPSFARIRRITNTQNSEPVVPARGPFASFTLWMEGLPDRCDLASLDVSVGGQTTAPSYIGLPERDGLQQINVMLGNLDRSGMLPLTINWNGVALCDPVTLRVIPPGPFVPFIVAVHDGVNVMSGLTIDSGSVKVTVEGTDKPERFRAEIAGTPIQEYDLFCVDPLLSRYEINFDVPAVVPSGEQPLLMKLGKRLLGSEVVEILRNS